VHSQPSLSVSEQYLDGVLVLAVSGDVDLTTAPSLVERIRAALERGDRRIVLDCRNVTFADSKLAEAVLVGAKRLRDIGGDLAVALPPQPARRVFEILGVDTVVAVRDSVTEAIHALRGGLPGDSAA